MPIVAVNVWAAILLGVAKMKNTKKVVFCGLMAAVATVIMLVAYFPYLTYAVPAVASLAIMVCLIELGVKWSFMAYLASILPIFLFCENESKLLYIVFFGFYPVIKVLIEKVPSRAIEWVIKLVVFNAIIVSTYFVVSNLLGVRIDEISFVGGYTIAVLLFLGNIVFVLYDICIERMAALYMVRLHNVVRRFLSR